VHVGVDVDRRRPARPGVARAHDAADVDVHVEVLAPLGHRSRGRRAAPRRVPRPSALRGVERVDALERAVDEAEKVRLRGADVDRIGHRDAGRGRTVDRGDVAPVASGCMPELASIDDRPELVAVADDVGDGAPGEVHGERSPCGVELVQAVLRPDEDARHPAMVSRDPSGRPNLESRP
jgi:hypothetical protein